MTRKRVKFGLALLGLLLAFLMGLLALMFVPTLASADKGSASAWEEDHGKSGNPAYFEPPNANQNGADGPGQSGSNPPHGDVGPCAAVPNSCAAWNGQEDGGWHYSGGHNPQGQNSEGQGGNGDPGHSSGNGDNPNGGQGGQGGQPGPFAGWLPSGGLPGGGGGPDTCSSGKGDSNSDKSDADSGKDAGKKSCDKNDDGSQQSGTPGNQPGDPTGNDPAGDPSGDIASGFFGSSPNPNNDPPGGDDVPDPNCFPFGDFCGPQNDDPPNTSPTDPATEVPEPFTLSLFAAGLTGAAALRRFRRKTIGRPLAG